MLEVLVQKRRDTKAARRASLGNCCLGQVAVPRVVVTDKLRSYGVANREISLTVCRHHQLKGLNIGLRVTARLLPPVEAKPRDVRHVFSDDVNDVS